MQEQEKPVTETPLLSERQKRISVLSKKKVGLDRNAGLCAFVITLLVYNMWNIPKNDTPPVWFFPTMGVLIAISLGMAIYDLVQSQKAKTELEKLRNEEEQEESNQTPPSIDDK